MHVKHTFNVEHREDLIIRKKHTRYKNTYIATKLKKNKEEQH